MISGRKNNKKITDAMGIPGKFLIKRPDAKIHAQKMAKAGLANSDGCMDMPKMVTQRVAPLTTCPKTGNHSNMKNEATKVINAIRRMCLGDNMDVPKITPMESAPKKSCLLTK